MITVGTIKHFAIGVNIFHVLFVLFGAPFLVDFEWTLALAAVQSLCSAVPVSIAVEGRTDDIIPFLVEKEFDPKKKALKFVAFLSLFGNWISAAVIPLDWDLWWQRYPIPNFVGATSGFVLGVALVLKVIFTSSQNRINYDKMQSELFENPSPKLKAIVFAEFDNKIGRVIRHQVPHNIFSTTHFDAFASAIIPSEDMRDRLIMVNMYDWKVMGYPVYIRNEKYERKVYIFNMCFVVDKQDTQSDCMYEPLVQKCAEYLVDMEVENEFLSRKDSRLEDLMERVFQGLNENGECIHSITNETTLFLKLCPAFHGREPPQVSSFMVPVFTKTPPISPADLSKMDVLSQKICPFIDGVCCVKDIASLIQVDVDLVKRCIRNLYFYGCVALLPIFLYSNYYMATPRVRQFMKKEKVVEECLEFVKKDKSLSIPTKSDLFRLYMSLTPNMDMQNWFRVHCPADYNIDERRFIQFGVHYNFIKVLKVYPQAEDWPESCVTELCNGENTVEGIATILSCSPYSLQKRLQELDLPMIYR
ncbi:unnamed protein product [Bursaphelenchus okinawaensis]|uniref:Uncharacterized protein n=1 Tax=Bursaphelenchus okinawaensis TaxID=465554 RepID=A0A811LQL8_9BILA|nr:unnamed protein product [Bursaphelenchus okinawaensis]CAG9126674.1 unnamed protein product [Bursaphelenchus okinawaensis]